MKHQTVLFPPTRESLLIFHAMQSTSSHHLAPDCHRLVATSKQNLKVRASEYPPKCAPDECIEFVSVVVGVLLAVCGSSKCTGVIWGEDTREREGERERTKGNKSEWPLEPPSLSQDVASPGSRPL